MYDDTLINEPWQQGRLLQTQQVKRWERLGQIIEINQLKEQEARMVFARFTSEDEGKSCIHICTCETAGEAEFIVKAHNVLLNSLNDMVEQYASLKKTAFEYTGDTRFNDD